LLRTNYGFRYAEQASPLMVIRQIGWESTATESYRWDGLTRGEKFVVFQYTIAGEGHLVYGDKRYTVPKHHGFFVKIPDDNQYYYQSNSNTPWEFIFLIAEGAHVFSYWNEIIENNGPIIALKPNSQPITMLWDMMQDAQNKTMLDKYDISIRLYEWIVSCLRSVDGKPETGQLIPDAIIKARRFMEEQYHRLLTLEEIATVAGTSKYHFCRLYIKYTGVTPISHLTKIRIEEAAKLLRQTNQSVASIASSTGFDNSSYFGKVFRRMMGASPQQFRDGHDKVIPANHILID
jgi:AraC-like DNA-binding protein